MIENKYPIFGNGQVINKEALDLLRDNPAELTDLLYLDKKDGIIQYCNNNRDIEHLNQDEK